MILNRRQRHIEERKRVKQEKGRQGKGEKRREAGEGNLGGRRIKEV